MKAMTRRTPWWTHVHTSEIELDLAERHWFRLELYAASGGRYFARYTVLFDFVVSSPDHPGQGIAIPVWEPFNARTNIESVFTAKTRSAAVREARRRLKDALKSIRGDGRLTNPEET